jgi:hypothetical protein
MATKNNTTVTESYILPSGDNELRSFSQRYKVDMMEQVVHSIEIAVNHKLPAVEIFQFKNSNFVITLLAKDFLSNLDNIYDYYMSNEVYEFCPRVIQLQKTLKETSIKPTDEKQKR